MVATGVSFADLDPKAREHALERYRDWDVGDEWWDGVYEDAKRMATLMGIATENIFFSGFWSQGDGASFTGSWTPAPEAVQAIKTECEDEDLIDFAQRLTAVAVSIALSDVESHNVKIRTSGNYSHSGTMSLECEVYDTQGYAEQPLGAETELLAVFREFADWIYGNLEAEYEHLTSDEHLAEQFAEAEIMFDEDGDMI